MANVWTQKANVVNEPWDSYHGYYRGLVVKVATTSPDSGKVDTYDRSTDKWTEHPSATKGGLTVGGASVVVANRLHCVELATHASLDMGALTWQDHEPVPIARQRHHMGGGYIGDKLYLVGGVFSGTGQVWLDIYDPATNTWTQGPNMPGAVGNTKAAVLDNELHVFGTVGTSHYIYNTVTNAWRSGTALPATSANSVASGGGWLWVVGANKTLYITKAGGDGAWTSKLALPTSQAVYTDASLVYGNKLLNWWGGGSWEHWQYEPDVTLIPEYGEYEGEEAGNTIYPAPERLPHSFSEIRDQLPRGIAQKLQENFEAIERQLLALDPDSKGSDPHR